MAHLQPVKVMPMFIRNRYVAALAALVLLLPFQASAEDDVGSEEEVLDVEFTPAQALDALAAVIECRAPVAVEKPMVSNLWRVALGSKRQPQPAFNEWKRIEQSNNALHEIELPAPITVFGHRAQRIALLSGGILAIVEGVQLVDISRQLNLAPLSETLAPHIHRRELSLRNAGYDGLHVRALSASKISTHPGTVLMGCEETFDTRSEQLRRRGKEQPMELAPEQDLVAELEAVLTCRADALRDSTARWAITLGPLVNNAHFKGWTTGEDEEGNRWSVPPAPIAIEGRPVARFVLLGQTLYAEQDGNIADALAEAWDLPAYDGWDEKAFVGFHDTDVAADGWLEDRARIAREWKPGKTLHGCEYTPHRPEFGETPNDEGWEG